MGNERVRRFVPFLTVAASRCSVRVHVHGPCTALHMSCSVRVHLLGPCKLNPVALSFFSLCRFNRLFYISLPLPVKLRIPIL